MNTEVLTHKSAFFRIFIKNRFIGLLLFEVVP